MSTTHGWEDVITLQQLRAVVAVARRGSFSAAAADLRTTQPSVSRAVAAIEATLDRPVFDRTTRRVRVRPDAEEFVERAARVLDDVRAAAASARGGSLPARRLDVSCLMSVASAHLAPALALLSSSHPALRVGCVEAMQTDVEEHVLRGTADIAVADVSSLPPGLTGRAMWTEPLHLCVPATHPLSRSPTVDLADVRAEELIAFPRQARLRADVDRLLATHGGSRAPHVVVQQYGTAFQLVAAGLGVVVVPACMVPLAPAATRSPRLADPGAQRTIGPVWRTGSVPTAAADDFVAALDSVIRDR